MAQLFSSCPLENHKAHPFRFRSHGVGVSLTCLTYRSAISQTSGSAVAEIVIPELTRRRWDSGECARDQRCFLNHESPACFSNGEKSFSFKVPLVWGRFELIASLSSALVGGR